MSKLLTIIMVVFNNVSFGKAIEGKGTSTFTLLLRNVYSIVDLTEMSALVVKQICVLLFTRTDLTSNSKRFKIILRISQNNRYTTFVSFCYGDKWIDLLNNLPCFMCFLVIYRCQTIRNTAPTSKT